MKKLTYLLFSLVVMTAVVADSDHSPQMNQINEVFGSTAMVFQKGLEYCEKNGYSFFKIQHLKTKSPYGNSIEMKGVTQEPNPSIYEEKNENCSFSIYCYSKKPKDDDAINVKEMLALYKAALAQYETPEESKEAPMCNKPIQPKEIASLDEYKEFIKKPGKTVFVKVYLDTCPPCRGIAPVFQKFAENNCSKAFFVSVNVKKVKGFKTAYSVQKVPTLLIIDENGALVDQIIGPAKIADYINNYPSSN